MPNASTSSQGPLAQWLIQACLILLVSASAILFIGQYTNLDLSIADYYYDIGRSTFPWDTTWFGRDLMHGYVKNVIVWTGFVIIGITLLDLARPTKQLSIPQRAGLRVLALSSLLEPLLIRTLKANSALHCPWGIDRYGGHNPFLRLLDTVPEYWQAGHCFPAGHASTAMWLSALAVFWLPDNPRRASWIFFGGIGVGVALGWVQQMRGQHFLTHTLWTAWLSSAIVVALIALFTRPLRVSLKTETIPSSARINTGEVVYQPQ